MCCCPMDCEDECPVDCDADCPCPPPDTDCVFPACPELGTPCPCDAHIVIPNNGNCSGGPDKFVCYGGLWTC